MAAFLRRFSYLPDVSVLTEIESVVVVDEPPPGQIQGVGTGTVLEVGEFEDGPFEAPTEVFGGADLRTQFGGFGFTYDGIPSQNPCARVRHPDSAVAASYWEGSAFVHLASCKFSRLFVCRVDTSVGSVEFNRLAAISGATDPTWNLEPGQTLKLKIDGGGAVTVTFDAAAATDNSSAGTYPWSPSGGETLDFVIDDVAYQAVFLSTDTTQTLVVARLNAAAGFTAFADEGGGVTSITGQVRGTDGNVQITGVSGAAVTTATGFAAGAAVPGTGDVANIDLVTDAEVTARVLADTSSAASFDRDAAGAGRVFSLTDDGTGSIEVDSTGTATAFGFATDAEVTAASGTDGTIPAGTRVQNSAGTRTYVTMQTVSVTAANAGPYSVKVRHATDDGTGLSTTANTVTSLGGNPIELGAFSVDNPLPLTAALTDAQVDAQYLAAVATTRALSGSKVREVNLIMSARQSNAVRAALKQNAVDASDGGCRGRVAVLRPPLGTTRAVARGSTQPGVGAYRDAGLGRALYAFPGVQKLIPEILARGTDGGAGFTADGVVDHGADAAVACLASSLNPEEDIGQETSGLVDWVLGVEAGNADVQNLVMADYVAFKAAGIMAPRIDGAVTIQSAVTTVDPTLYPEAVAYNRRHFADFCSDSTAEFARKFSKKLQTPEARAVLVSRVDSFYSQLGARIEGRRVTGGKEAGNTPDLLARNLFFILQKVRMTPTFGTIVLRMQVGNNVVVEES